MSVGFEDLFPNLVLEKKDGGNYFFVDGNCRYYKYLIEMSYTYEKSMEIIKQNAFAPWHVPETDHRTILGMMKKEKINSCEVFLKCSETKPTLICTLPYIEKFHAHLSKGNL